MKRLATATLLSLPAAAVPTSDTTADLKVGPYKSNQVGLYESNRYVSDDARGRIWKITYTGER